MEVDKAFKHVYSSSEGSKTGPSCPSGVLLCKFIAVDVDGDGMYYYYANLLR